MCSHPGDQDPKFGLGYSDAQGGLLDTNSSGKFPDVQVLVISNGHFSYLPFLGICHDCCLWFGIYYSYLVCWMLLSIPRMARKTALCEETILCNR